MVDQEVIHKLKLLSGREREVLKLFCEGNEYKTIGEILFIGENTVKTHMGNIYIKLGLDQLPSSARRMIIHRTYCPAVYEMVLVPQEKKPTKPEPKEPESVEPESMEPESVEPEPEDSEEPEPVPDEVLEMVEKDEKALVVIEPIIVDIPPIGEEPKTNPKKDEGKVKQIKPKGDGKIRRFLRWMLFIMIIALIVFGGMQVYAWARGFINDVVQPIINQNIPEQSQPQPQAQVVPTDTIKSTVPTPAPAQQVAVPTSTSQPTAPPQPKILFSDNFNSGLSSGWQVAYGNPIIVNGVLSTDQDTLLIVGDTSWRDYAVEFDADAGDCWLSAGENWVSVRTVDTDNNYAYKWEDCESYWYVVKNGSWNEIPKSEFSPGYDTLRFKVQVQGGNMSVYVDGTLMSSFFDNGYSQGRVILKISENTTIDNFVIKELE